MPDYLDSIKHFRPTTQQEKVDQHQILIYESLFSNLLERQNTIAHYTSSLFIINKERTKVLFIYHKLYDAWCWVGGHADGEKNLAKVALKEAQEETGLVDVSLISKEIVSLDILPVAGHFKKGKWVSAHQHLSVAFLGEADDTLPLKVNQEETKAVSWLPIEQLEVKSGEAHMLPIYQKIVAKI